jgi:hypothetical protein
MSLVTDDQLRALIREAVGRHLATPARPAAPATVLAPPRPLLAAHAGEGPRDVSHYQYLTLVNVGEACVIEPSVPCNHCGYCRSHGH